MSDLKAEYEKLVAGMNPQGYIYRYADGIREGTNGRSINGGYPLETIRYYLAPAIVELLLAERRKVLAEADAAFKEAFSGQDEPLIGVMRGLKAMSALGGTE